MQTTWHLVVASVMVLSSICACSPVYSPPIRSTHYGAPGRLDPGDGEVAAAGSMYGNGTLTGGIPVSKNLRLEVGADGGMNTGKWILGVAGLRWTVPIGNRQAPEVAIADTPYKRKGWFMDVEGGFGLGVGGELYEDDGEPSHLDTEIGTPWDRFAGGVYTGLGFGFWAKDWLSLFGRARFQVTAAQGLPDTVWYSSVLGVEFRPSPVSIYLGTGLGGYVNSKDQDSNVLAEAGLSVSF